MHYAVKTLLEEREKIVNALKNGDQNRLKDLQELDKAIAWIEVLMANQLDRARDYSVEPLPSTVGYGYSSYHLMIDMESNNVQDWLEYRPKGEDLLLGEGDILLIHK